MSGPASVVSKRGQPVGKTSPPRSRPAPKVFISHASTDRWVARQLARQIQACGADVFLDCEDVAHGDDFEARILVGAEESDELLVLFTPAARERKYVWLEIGMFFGVRKRIVAALYGVTMDELAADRATPLALKRIDCLELDHIDTYLRQLRERVRSRRTRRHA